MNFTANISLEDRLNLYWETLYFTLYSDHKRTLKMRTVDPTAPRRESCLCLREEWREQKAEEWHLVREQVKGWMHKKKNKVKAVVRRQKVDTGRKKGASWNSLPKELKEMIWNLVLPVEGGRVHELIPDPKQRRRPERVPNRMVLRSNNTHIPAMLHVAREWRVKALDVYQLCQYTPVVPHPADWKMEHTCVKIKPFYFHKETDTLYLPNNTAEWLGYVWARTEAVWVYNLFSGWQHIGLDFRSPSWVGRTPGHITAPMETVFSKPPAILFRDMFPSLKHLSICIDFSKKNCPTPLENNTSFTKTTLRVSSWIVGRCLVSLWNEFLMLEYEANEIPKVEFQEVIRKQEKAGWADKWITFGLQQYR